MMRAEPSRGIGLDLTVAFTQGEGRCRLLRPSRFLNQAGRWRIDGLYSGAAMEWRIKCTTTVNVDDEIVVPADTPLYFSATVSQADEKARRAAMLRGVADTGGLQLTNGRVSVLEGTGAWGPELSRATGSTRLVQVGTFEAVAIPTAEFAQK